MVENAIRHGIARRAGDARLQIRGVRRSDELLIEIRNPGDLSRRITDGLGLTNTRERLAHLYGDRAALELDEDDGEVTAKLRLPTELTE